MNSIHNDSRVPLKVRIELADAALLYAATLVDICVTDKYGYTWTQETAKAALDEAAEDCHICVRAAEMGMV